MPRKTKEQINLESNEKEKKQTKKTASAAAKKTASSKKSAPKKTATKKSTTTAKKTTKPKTKTVTKTKTTTKAKKETKAKTTTKAKKETKAKTTTKSKKVTTKKKSFEVVEYYDLPQTYNQTVVKVLAQTPTHLFIYWEISKEDKKNYEEKYGLDFFHTTKPVLEIYNDTLGYSYEVVINDFANSWYLTVPDSKCNYHVTLIRKPIEYDVIKEDIPISTSNEITSPNDHILIDEQQHMAYFRDVKTGNQTKKSVASLSYIQNMGKVYHMYDFYKTIYKEENIKKIYDSSNPSS